MFFFPGHQECFEEYAELFDVPRPSNADLTVSHRSPQFALGYECCWFILGGGSNMFYFHPYLGKIPILTNIFQMGWKHQLVGIIYPPLN